MTSQSRSRGNGAPTDGYNIIQFTTAFTAQRTSTLPNPYSDDLFNGIQVKIILDGAVNGANTLVIKQGGSTIRTETNDKRVLTYQWRRFTWRLVGYETLP